jgi:hypothetical protein
VPVVEVVHVVVMRDGAVAAAVTVDVVVFGEVVLPMRRVIQLAYPPSVGAAGARRDRERNGQPAAPANTGPRRYLRNDARSSTTRVG